MTTMLLLLLAQEEAPVFTRFEFARERVGHKVVADATLVNTLDRELVAARVVAIYYDGDRELRRSKMWEIPRVLSGASTSFKLEAEQVPNFSRYEVYVEYGGKTRVYLGTDPLKPPTLRKSAPARLLVAGTRDEPPKSFPGEAALTLTVRNAGETEAIEPTAVISFLDVSAAVVRKERVRLEAEVKGASEDTFVVRVPAMPEYASVQASLAWLAAEGPSIREEGKGDSVAVRTFRVIRLTDGSARITGTVRNGLSGPVEKVALGFKLGKTAAPFTVPGGLQAGETRDFEFYVADCPPFDQAGFDLSYSDGKGAGTPPPARPTARRLESRAIELAGPKLPDAPAARQDEKKDDQAPALSVAIRGLLVVQGGRTQLGNKYNGDVYLMRAAFLDREGKTAQPTGTFDIVIYDGEKPYKKVQRIMTKAQWRADAAKVNELTVSNNTICCDKKTGEIWIALLRTDGPGGFTPRADVKLTIREHGVWTWKGLQEKWEAAPKGPDEKKK